MRAIASILAALFLTFVITACADNGSNHNVLDAKKGVLAIMVEKVAADGKQAGGLGTGFLIGENKILTNDHVISDGKVIKVMLENSDDMYDATVVKTDPIADMAVIELKDWDKFKKENKFRVLKLADPGDLEVTEEVYTIGHPWGLYWSVSRGILSAVDKKPSASPKVLLQVDAHVYEGNSGGPLLNDYGQVLGINSLMISNNGGSYGMALPVSMIERVMRDWDEYGEVRWAQLGISIDGGEIKSVTSGSPAERDGLKIGDVIKTFTTSEGTYDPKFKSLPVAMAIHDSGKSVKLVVQRAGRDVEVEVHPVWKTSSELVSMGVE